LQSEVLPLKGELEGVFKKLPKIIPSPSILIPKHLLFSEPDAQGQCQQPSTKPEKPEGSAQNHANPKKTDSITNYEATRKYLNEEEIPIEGMSSR
jgi:hypothetical protein